MSDKKTKENWQKKLPDKAIQGLKSQIENFKDSDNEKKTKVGVPEKIYLEDQDSKSLKPFKCVADEEVFS